MFEKIRKWIVKMFMREQDGYTFTGFSEKQPIKFYYCESDDTYYMGIRYGTMYYARPTLSGWSIEMSRYLDWESLKMSEPKEIDFQIWIHGILNNIHRQYKSLDKTTINNVSVFDNRH